jgi:hypothetical protein
MVNQIPTAKEGCTLKKTWIVFWTIVLAVFSLQLSSVSVKAADDGYLYWGPVKTGVYTQLHPYTLNWSGDVLDKGGLNLISMKLTTKSSEADLVMNQYGAVGASAMVKLDETLEERTTVYQTGYMNSYTMAAGDVYLIMLHDGKYAKLRIDQLLPAKVAFSYVLEGQPEDANSGSTPAESTATATATATATPKPSVTPKPEATTKTSPTPKAAVTSKPSATPDPIVTPKPDKTEKPFKMKIIVGEKSAVVQGQSRKMEVAPAIVNGSTLVPIRFISETLGAKVDWEGGEQKITITLMDQKIILWIDTPFAMVNGKKFDLEVAPTIFDGGTTVVPLRFVSESFNQVVEYEEATRTITIIGVIMDVTLNDTNKEPNGSSGDSAEELTFASEVYGDWDLYISGVDLPDSMGKLIINSDGTFIYQLRKLPEAKGSWRAAKVGEVKDYPEAIILMGDLVKRPDMAVTSGDNGGIIIHESYLGTPGGLYGGAKVAWRTILTGVKQSDSSLDFGKDYDPDLNYHSYAGNYDLWIQGGATPLYHADTGSYATHSYTPGADGGTLTVNEDGSYTMNTGAEEVNGSWRPSGADEVYGYPFSIILENGPDGTDWVLLLNESEKYMVSYDSGGTYTDGSMIWLPMYVATPR